MPNAATAKINVAIDTYTNMLKARAMQDKIKIKTRLNSLYMTLMIHAEYDCAVIKAESDVSKIVLNVSNIGQIVDSDYELIKQIFIEIFEEEENNQEESEVDEHWELVDLGGV